MAARANVWWAAGIACSFVSATGTAQSLPAATDELEEVVVTASKTGENIRDITGSVGAITGASLEQLGAQSATDYLGRMPGVVFNAATPGLSTVTIRGVNTSTGFAQLSQATTGIYVNDVPLTDPFFTAGTPDIDTFDLDRVEVHRGPQGTLFGSSSLGGAVNYIVKRASPDALDLGVETTQSTTDHSDGINSTYKLRLNVPLVDDTLAFRAVGIRRREQGYLDNAGTGVDDSNDATIEGARALLDWLPAEGTRLSWLTLYQQTQLDDASYQDRDVGELQFTGAFPQRSRVKVLIHSLAWEQEFGVGKLTTTGSYHEKSGFITSDLTSRFGFAGLVPYSAIADAIDSEGYSFEARLVSPRGGKFDWLIGAMYNRTDEDIEEIASAPGAAAAIDTLFGPGLGALLTQGDHWASSLEDFTGQELALFGEGKYSLTDNLHLTAGGRLFKTRIDSQLQADGVIIFFGSGLPRIEQSVAQDEQGFNPKLALSYDLSRDTQVYVLASKGFRFGGTNVNPGAPKLTFDSDSLWNYEFGLKGESVGRELQFDLSAFHIDWSDIQLSLVDPLTGGTYTGNAGDATIDGVEAALSWGNPRGWQASTSITWLDARLSEDFDPGFGSVVPRDTELPGASEWQLSNLLAYRFDNAFTPHFVVSHRYVSEARGVLDYSGAPTGDYNIFDLRAGLTLGTVSLTLFASNLTDERAVTAATYYAQPTALETHEYLMRPRTFGLTVAWSLQ